MVVRTCRTCYQKANARASRWHQREPWSRSQAEGNPHSSKHDFLLGQCRSRFRTVRSGFLTPNQSESRSPVSLMAGEGGVFSVMAEQWIFIFDSSVVMAFMSVCDSVACASQEFVRSVQHNTVVHGSLVLVTLNVLDALFL